jgi:hypothetical protein
MTLELSDILFLIIVIWIVWEIMNDGGGGGKRERVPVY